MKKIGLIGGTGPVSTLQYYEELTSRSFRALGTGDVAPLAIDSVNCREVFRLSAAKDWEGLARYFLEAVRRLSAVGAEAAAFTGMTPHRVFREVEEASPIPLVSMLSVMAEEAKREGLSRVLILGSRTSMTEAFVREPLNRVGIKTFAPAEKEQEEIQSVIESEVEYGLCTPEKRGRLIGIAADAAKRAGAESVVLANTDFPAYFRGTALPFRTLDPVALHIARLSAIACES